MSGQRPFSTAASVALKDLRPGRGSVRRSPAVLLRPDPCQVPQQPQREPIFMKSRCLRCRLAKRRSPGTPCVLSGLHRRVWPCTPRGWPTSRVASCGHHRVGDDHVSVLACGRLRLDERRVPRRGDLTFDGDEGRPESGASRHSRATSRSHADLRWPGPDGMDPCDVAAAKAWVSVRELSPGRHSAVRVRHPPCL